MRISVRNVLRGAVPVSSPEKQLIMEFVSKEFQPSERTRNLMEAKGQEVGISIEWTPGGGEIELTLDEMKALRRKHESRNVNYTRAAAVKRLMLEGRKCSEIVTMLHKDYRQTMVKRDHAALSDRGVAKKGR